MAEICGHVGIGYVSISQPKSAVTLLLFRKRAGQVACLVLGYRDAFMPDGQLPL